MSDSNLPVCFQQLRLTMAAIHFFKRFDDGFALGLGLGVPHRVAQRFIGNIHRRFHADIFAQIGILVNVTQQKSVFQLCSN